MLVDTSLRRFISAQQTDYQTALAEIRGGRKRSHWMWYIFPQIRGLGFSQASKYYAIKDAAEAQEYLAHPVLGSRLIEIAGELLKVPGNDATRLLGTPDDLKLKSSMTLFAALPQANPVFQQVLDKFYGGKPDDATLRLLERL